MIADYATHDPYLNNYDQALLFGQFKNKDVKVTKAKSIGWEANLSPFNDGTLRLESYGSGLSRKQYVTASIAEHFRDWTYTLFEEQYAGQKALMEGTFTFMDKIGAGASDKVIQQTEKHYADFFFHDGLAFLAEDVYFFFNNNQVKIEERQLENRQEFSELLKKVKENKKEEIKANTANIENLLEEPDKLKPIKGQTGPLASINIKYDDPDLKDDTVIVDIKEIIKISGYSFSPLIRGERHYIKWQEDVIYDENRFISVVGSRQWGKSHVMALRGLIASFKWYRRDIWVFAFQNETTSHIQKYMMRLMENFPDGTFSISRQKQWIVNNLTGSRIIFRSLSKEADRIRGWTLHEVIMDECYLIEDNIYEAVILPTLSTTGGTVCMISTPGPKNWFYWEVMNAKMGEKNYSYYQFTILDNPFIVPEEKERILKKKNDPTIRREWFCEFDEGANQVFRPRKTDSINFYVDHKHESFFVFAYDPARKGRDRAGYTCYQVCNGKVFVIKSGFIPDEFKGQWNSQFDWMLENILCDHDYRVVVDCTGVGDGVVLLMQEYGIEVHMAIQYTAWVTESEDLDRPYGKARALRVGKSRLINNTQNYLDEDVVSFYSYTNTYLFLEMDGIVEKKSIMGYSTFTTKWFDDITNSCMIGLYYIEAEWLLTKKIHGVKVREDLMANEPYRQKANQFQGIRHKHHAQSGVHF